MGVVIKSYRTKVSSYADKDGNFRALNSDDHPGFVGYGRTPEEAKENWKAGGVGAQASEPARLRRGRVHGSRRG